MPSMYIHMSLETKIRCRLQTPAGVFFFLFFFDFFFILQGTDELNSQKMSASGEGEEELIVNNGCLMWHNNELAHTVLMLCPAVSLRTLRQDWRLSSTDVR